MFTVFHPALQIMRGCVTFEAGEVITFKSEAEAERAEMKCSGFVRREGCDVIFTEQFTLAIELPEEFSPEGSFARPCSSPSTFHRKFSAQ